MRIAICEDSQLDRELLVGVVDHYAAQRGRSIQVTAYGGGLGLIHDVEDGEHFDLAFLDNLMDDILGIEVARRLRELEFSRSAGVHLLHRRLCRGRVSGGRSGLSPQAL